MKLEKWLTLNNISTTDFANMIGKPASSVHRYVYEDVIPKRDVMQRIYIITSALVDANDFYEIDQSLFTYDPVNDNEKIYKGQRYDD